MPPVQSDGPKPRRCGQFFHHIGAIEIVSAGLVIKTEAFQGLSDLLHDSKGRRSVIQDASMRGCAEYIRAREATRAPRSAQFIRRVCVTGKFE